MGLRREEKKSGHGMGGKGELYIKNLLGGFVFLDWDWRGFFLLGGMG